MDHTYRTFPVDFLITWKANVSLDVILISYFGAVGFSFGRLTSKGTL